LEIYLRLDRDCLICDCWEGDDWNINFRRALGEADMREWEILMNILEEYRLNGEDDQFVWILDKSGNYTTRSM
jgi:hypothetical protein